MPAHAADRLIAAIEAKGAPVCVGIDPVVEKLPRAILELSDVQLLEHFPLCQELSEDSQREMRDRTRIHLYVWQLLQALLAHVPCIKFQSACFESLGSAGVDELIEGIHMTKRWGGQVVLDAKRGDIGISAEHYATAAFGGVHKPQAWGVSDWITINSYLGRDGIEPFLRPGHGAFALVRTSNPGGDAIQGAILKTGQTVAEHVASIIAEIGEDHLGSRGFSSLGAVVGATKREDAKQLRNIMPHQMFLVPGYGAQGGGIDDVLPCFHSDGGGAIVTASRSVIYAFDKDDPNWAESVGEAAAKFADEVGRAAGMR